MYAFASNQFKPYVRELYGVNGLNILRDAPADHLHHHGLMYAIRVNGVNFWEEVGQPGHEVAVGLFSHHSRRNRRGLPEASFSHMIHWVPHTNPASAGTIITPLLMETRTIVVTVDVSNREISVDWRCEFEVGRSRVTLTGSAYNGLGLRLPQEFDHIAVRQNSENASYSKEANWDVTLAQWSSVSGHVGNRTATATLFGTPSNRGEARFFSMLNPFAYLSVTQNLEKQAIEYSEGERFSIRYLLAVYAEEKSAEFLNNRYARWLEDLK